jgi:hypothetical protein
VSREPGGAPRRHHPLLAKMTGSTARCHLAGHGRDLR